MMLAKSAIIVLLGLCACSGQEVEDYEGNDQPAVVSARKTQDASILNQIHRHNEDGSYTYGFEGSDGSFKIETKTRTGEVSGKYGYVDDTGKLRVVEYGASKHGFQPSGEGITVPAPTLVESRPEDDGEPETGPAEPPRPAVKKPASARQQKPVQFQMPEEPVRQRPTAQRAPAAGSARNDGGWTAGLARSLTESSHRPAGGIARPSPPVSGHYREAAPEAREPEARGLEAPSGSYQTSQQFGDSAWAVERPKAPVVQSYRTYEDEQEPTSAEPNYRPAAVPSRPTGRNGGAGAPRTIGVASYRTAPRQARPSGVFDQLVEQYALPESGSPVSHSNSFGL